MQMTFKNIVKEQVPPQVIISIIFVAMLAIGYGVWSQETSGTIALSAPTYGTELYVDGQIAGVSKSAGEKMSYQYIEGKHSVIVSRGDFWPWTKDVTLSAKETETLRPLLVRKDVKPSLVVAKVYNNGVISESPEYTDALARIDGAVISDQIKAALAPIQFKDVRSADYFPGRTDVLLVAVNDGVFAVETGTSTPRNFLPVYKGTSPEFVLSDNSSILVKDGSSIFRIVGFDK